MAAQRLGAAAREAGLLVPAFRSPPRRDGSVRTIRRIHGGAVIAVQIRSRPFDRVVADMVEGILAANELEGEAARRLRLALWEASWSEARMAERQTQAA